ncbi:MAG: FtsX-like permease family protein [Deltaproteobacteria bacterium]
MRATTAIALAVAETRRARGALAFCIGSVAVGVFGMTAVGAVTESLDAGLDEETKAVFGADLEISSNQPLTTSTVARTFTQDLVAKGARSAELARFYSMLTPNAGEGTQLVRVHGVGDGFPFFGEIPTEPPGAYATLTATPSVVIDEVTARSLGLEVGDRAQLGKLDVVVVGQLVDKAGTPAAEFSLAPPIYVHHRFLEATGLLARGSRMRYRRMFALPDGLDGETLKAEHFDAAIAEHVTIRTSREAASRVRRFVDRLGAFLTIMGLITLLLGALGIGSAMNAFVRGKLDHAAILRCVGARPRDVFVVYFVLAMIVAGVGCSIGVVCGSLLPAMFSGLAESIGGAYLPTHVTLAPSTSAAIRAAFAGLLATAVFTLQPMWRIANVKPMTVLRRDTEGLGALGWRRRITSFVGFAVAFGFVLLLSAAQTASLTLAAWFTGAIAASVVLLAVVAWLLVRLSKVLARHVPSYAVRQGIANLHRPGNQTQSVVVAVGVGFLLLASILIIQASMRASIAIDQQKDLPNVFIVDIQPDQEAEIRAALTALDAADENFAPMISARLRAVDGVPVDKSKVERDARQRTFEDRMTTREYFVTYRETTAANEEVVDGTFWIGRPERQEVSLDERLAGAIGADIGATLTLDVQGLPLDATVTSLRRIRWQALTPNALVVLSPGDIENAPKMFVASARLPSADARFELQRRLATRFPNLSVVDITAAAETVVGLLEQISIVFTALGFLAVVTGAIILGGAIAAGRARREREAMLLKVLGASRAALRRVLVAEYASLAVFGVGAGWVLAELVNRIALPALFEVPAVVPYGSLVPIAVATVTLETLVGALIGRSVFAKAPLDVLRGP